MVTSACAIRCRHTHIKLIIMIFSHCRTVVAQLTVREATAARQRRPHWTGCLALRLRHQGRTGITPRTTPDEDLT